MGLALAALTIALGGCMKTHEDVANPVDVSTLDPFTQGLVYARSGDVEKLDACLNANSNILFECGSDGMSLLHYAAISSQPGTVKLLLDRGAETRAINDENRTPLEAAIAEHANEKVIDLLRNASGT
jgi:ankyrin repeat protein